jgi:hypothetical protein
MEEHNIICDECGVFPIQGKRYKSINIYDYDCCGTCIKDNHANDRDNFMAFENPTSDEEADQVGPEEDNRISAASARVAEEQFRSGRNAPLAIFAFFDNPAAEECQAVVDFIKRHEFLTNIEIHMCNEFISYEDSIAILAQGLVQCKSIRMISWSISYSDRKAPRNSTPLKSLIEENKQLEVFLLLQPCDGDDSRLERGSGEEEWASCLFEALQKNRTIKTFRLDTCSSLSQNTKELAWEATKSNPSLIQVHASFEEKDCHLDMLTSLNRNPQWMKCWTDVAASAKARIRVIEEILDSEMGQVVPLLFYLFQSFPEALQMSK